MSRRWTVELFGGLRAVSAERELTRFRTRKTAALFGYLCLYPERPHAREALAELLWPGCGDEEGRHSLGTALWSLRRQLQLTTDDAPVLLAGRHTAAINPEVVGSDATAFRGWLRRAAHAASDRERAAALGQAVELYHGEVMAGFQEEWLQSCRRDYRELYRAAVIDWVKHLQATGQQAATLRYLGQAVAVADDEALRRLRAEVQGEDSLPAPPAAPQGNEQAVPLPTGTVTFLLVGAAAARLPQFAAVVHRHQGRPLQPGDQPRAAFACADDAVACAAALREAGGAGLRIALETGRATPEQGHYYTPAQERAARLLLATGEGQTLCSERTASLARWWWSRTTSGSNPPRPRLELAGRSTIGRRVRHRSGRFSSARPATGPAHPAPRAPGPRHRPR